MSSAALSDDESQICLRFREQKDGKTYTSPHVCDIDEF